MVSAYIDAYKYLGEEHYLQKAKHLANYLIKEHIKASGKIQRTQHADTQGYLDDYAYTMAALIQLYQASFDLKYLAKAKALAEQVSVNFRQSPSGYFEYSPNSKLFIDSDLQIADGVLPSANAVLADAFYSLGMLYQNEPFAKLATQMAGSISLSLSNSKHHVNYYYWANLLQKLEKQPIEVQILGKNGLNVLKQFRVFEGVLLLGSKKGEPLPLLEHKFVKNKTIIYVCQNKICKMPTEDVLEAKEILNSIVKDR
jgi:uncharacterized protein